MAEITEVTGITDQMLEKELGPSVAVARTVIDYGQKDRNPVVSFVLPSLLHHNNHNHNDNLFQTAMLFHTKKGEVVTKSDTELKNFVPKEIAFEKVYVFLR